jgi:hypothetical protein
MDWQDVRNYLTPVGYFVYRNLYPLPQKLWFQPFIWYGKHIRNGLIEQLFMDSDEQ